MNNKNRRAAMLVVAALLGSTGAARAADSTDPIKLTLHDWTGQLITTRLMGEALKAGGNNVEYVQADYLAQFPGLESGDLHVAMEIWQTTGKEAMDASLATGNTVDLGETGMEAKEEWWYPAYMAEKCPGLPNWEALKDPACAEAFATAGDLARGPLSRRAGDLGRLRRGAGGSAGPAVRGGPCRHRRRTVRRAGERLPAPGAVHRLDLHAALGADQIRGRLDPVPRIRGRLLQRSDMGPNPDATHDCGKPHGWIKKVGWAGGEEKWPAAYAAIRNFKIDNKTMGELIAKVDLEGQKVEDVVAGWMKDNEATWKAWIGG